jgi:multidrug efflux pump subunit AcrA (membrane-fusion protein)
MKRLLLALSLALGLACDLAPTDGEWVTVERGDLLIEVDVSGTLRAVDSDSIKPPSVRDAWEFTISMMVPEGATVKQGEPILAFDASDLRRHLERKQAERDTAATQVESSRAQALVTHYDDALARADADAQQRKAELKADVPEEIVASHDLQKAQMDVELARAKVEHLESKSHDARRRSEAEIARWEHQHKRAEASVQQLSQAIEQMTIMAPRDGTVVYETDWRGQKNKVGDSVWRMATVMQVVSLDAMEGVGEVDEVDSSHIARGQSVALHLDAQPDVVLHGTIESVSTTVRRQSPDNPLKVAELHIVLLPNEQLRLRPGMRFRGKIVTQRVPDAIVVPLDAIVPTTDGPMARVRRGSDVELVPVEVGRRNNDMVEITAGLEVGEELLRGIDDA